jgi:RNA polymerase sigma-70 factor (ECF subfamily)
VSVIEHQAVLAFETFYRAESDRVYRALAVTLGDPHLAREAADEAMVRAYAHWGRVGHHENPGGWAYRVGLNWATSFWRKVRRERPLSDVTPDHPGADPPEASGVRALTALRKLPLAQRTVVVCRVLLDMSTVETAEILGVAEGTVRSRLSRALADLRVALGEER